MKKIVLAAIILVFPVMVFAAAKVDINTASLKELDAIIGVGPAIAQRIIDGRPYYSVDDLLKVKGIGNITLEEIKKQGLAYTDPNLQPPPPPAPAKPSAPKPKTILPKATKTDTTVTIAPVAVASVAAVSESPVGGDSSPWMMFIIAGGAAIVAGAVFLGIKLMVLKKDVRP